MAIRAKFVVSKLSKIRANNSQGQPGFGFEVTMYPVAGGPNATEEDKAFWSATPSGEIRMGIINAAAGQQFEPGDAWYVDFTKAE